MSFRHATILYIYIYIYTRYHLGSAHQFVQLPDAALLPLPDRSQHHASVSRDGLFEAGSLHSTRRQHALPVVDQSVRSMQGDRELRKRRRKFDQFKLFTGEIHWRKRTDGARGLRHVTT